MPQDQYPGNFGVFTITGGQTVTFTGGGSFLFVITSVQVVVSGSITDAVDMVINSTLVQKFAAPGSTALPASYNENMSLCIGPPLTVVSFTASAGANASGSVSGYYWTPSPSSPAST